jgi:uncharacterized protein (DUF2147 family)
MAIIDPSIVQLGYQHKEAVMKITLKSIAMGAALSTASMAAMAADPIVGVWQTYEDGQPKAQVQVVQNGQTFAGKIVAGNTEKAKTFIGRNVIAGLKADGGGKYSAGTITDPAKNKSYKLTAKISGNTLDLSGHLGPFSRTQTWKKIR